VIDLIEFLRIQKPLPAFEWDKNITNASLDHVLDTGPKGLCGHEGSDKSLAKQRLSRYGIVAGGNGETIDYGSKTGRLAILSLVIDDGNLSRVDRKLLFSPIYRKCGIASGYHKDFNVMHIFDFAENMIS